LGKIVGLLGFIGSGKGTVADILVEHGYVKLSWADSVKDATAAVFDWDRKLLEGDTDESRAFRETPDAWWSERFEYDFTPRLALQLMGTEAGRNVFDQDVWVYALERRMQTYPAATNFVIPDTRFPNECAMIHDLGGKLVWVKRDILPPWYEDALHANMTEQEEIMAQRWPKVHYSEWAWIGCPIDHEIENHFSLEDLRAKTVELFKL
jgi:hypothetical protein